MNYSHFIITRFNLPQKWQADKNGKKVLGNVWLEKRFKLFEDYCLPSVASQTNKKFKWWVYFDSKTPQVYKDKIATYSRQYVFFCPKYKQNYELFLAGLAYDIKKEANDTAVVITTRLDNDDVLSKSFVAEIQNTVTDEECILEFPKGYNLTIFKETKLKEMTYPLNPFISLVEKLDDTLKTVYAKDHGGWENTPKKVVSNRPNWVQIIHDSNVYNFEKGKDVFTFNSLQDFVFKKPKPNYKNDIRLLVKDLIKTIKNLIG